MKMQIKNIFLVILFSCLFITSYGITFSDPDKAIVVSAKSPVFIIRLASNPTTGYSWHGKKFNKHYLKLMKHEYIKPPRLMPGAPGYEEWIFRVKPFAFKTAANPQITFLYGRPWEKKFVKQATFKVVMK